MFVQEQPSFVAGPALTKAGDEMSLTTNTSRFTEIRTSTPGLHRRPSRPWNSPLRMPLALVLLVIAGLCLPFAPIPLSSIETLKGWPYPGRLFSKYSMLLYATGTPAHISNGVELPLIYDLAALAEGTSIFHDVTSSTYMPDKNTGFFERLFGYEDILSSPSNVLASQSIPAAPCWAIAGTEGTLGLRLPGPSIISNITLTPAISRPMRKAFPRRVDVWAFYRMVGVRPFLTLSPPFVEVLGRLDLHPAWVAHGILHGEDSQSQEVVATPAGEQAPIDVIVLAMGDGAGSPYLCVKGVMVYGFRAG
ncbi:hypothetical protein K488DRAFT_89458 [Vararia minispora EC-137]|uniref:Uncharacterized protein n=1 Tax=Vararia minispora EC-137 TaxID=1314806 RepID=A0ACB8QAA1_9AGAM|nr:hypothetical protein K488DRAFT_89458 [Vararia minispora EC-137]